MKGTENPHKNHRSRLRAHFLQGGLSGFAPHNVLELLLFFPLPRRDTNPLAHTLLSAHGSVGAVLSADARTLCGTHGVGEGVAAFFRAFSAVRELAFASGRPPVQLTDRAALARYLQGCLSGVDDGVAILYLDNAMSPIGERILCGVSVHSAAFPISDILREGLLSRAASVAVGHLHADGLALPRREDLDTTALLRDALAAGGLRLAEHFIISGEHYSTLLYRESGRILRPAVRELPEEDRTDGEERRALAELLRTARISLPVDPLLRTFGGLYRLVTALPAHYLYAGLDERAATLLSLVGAVDTYTVLERGMPPASERTALGQHLCDLYRAAGEERVHLLLFDRKGRYISTVLLGTGGVSEAAISLRCMVEGTLLAGAVTAVLSHNHPHGKAEPSNEDRRATSLVAAALGTLNVSLQCHYIVAGSDFCIIE